MIGLTGEVCGVNMEIPPKMLDLGMDMGENLGVGSPGISALPGDSIRESLSELLLSGLSPSESSPHLLWSPEEAKAPQLNEEWGNCKCSGSPLHQAMQVKCTENSDQI